ncbi:MAG: phosphoadenosine phosphosulfate reductase [Pseudomonadota bacterium]
MSPHPLYDQSTASASGLSQMAWAMRLERIGEDHGVFEALDPHHRALFVEEGDTLLVSFDHAARMFHKDRTGLPIGFSAVERREWSLLSIIADGDTWFRAPEVIALFDRLKTGGVFESFSKVIFLGIGAAAGHAACAFSAAAPGASVLAVTPAATQDPARAGFDTRHRAARTKDFTGPYGYGPDAIASAAQAVILYDPYDAPGAGHATQYHGANVLPVPLRFTGPTIGKLVEEGGHLLPMLRGMERGNLDRAQIDAMLRPTRRRSPEYLHHLAGVAQAAGQFDRARVIATHAAKATEQAKFVKLAKLLAPEPTE